MNFNIGKTQKLVTEKNLHPILERSVNSYPFRYELCYVFLTDTKMSKGQKIKKKVIFGLNFIEKNFHYKYKVDKKKKKSRKQ